MCIRDRREAIDELAFLLQQALRDQHRHSHVLMAGSLEPGIQILLDQFPDGLTIGAQDDKALHTGILHQLCLYADIGVPCLLYTSPVLSTVPFHVPLDRVPVEVSPSLVSSARSFTDT